MTKIEEETKCTTGPTPLWPDTVQCEGKPSQYLWGDPYCEKCAKSLIEIHAKVCKST